MILPETFYWEALNEDGIQLLKNWIKKGGKIIAMGESVGLFNDKKEFGISQISMNLTNITATPIHVVFDEIINKANKRGVRVTGSEIVGLIPLKSMIDAGKYFLKKQKRIIVYLIFKLLSVCFVLNLGISLPVF